MDRSIGGGMRKDGKYSRAIAAGDVFNLVEQNNAEVIAIVEHKDVKNDIFVYGDNKDNTKVVVFVYPDCNKRQRYAAMPIVSFLYSAVLKWEVEHGKVFTAATRKTFFEKNGIKYD